jgi:hypothetical protein
MSTESVLNHHGQTFAAGDLDGIMEDYNGGFGPHRAGDGTLTGLDSIRGAFAGFFEGLFKPGSYEFTMDRVEIVGDVGYIVWHSVNQGAEVTLGTDTFMLRDGKIAVQTFAARVEEK